MFATNLDRSLIQEINISTTAIADRSKLLANDAQVLMELVPRLLYFAYNASLVLYYGLVFGVSALLLLTIGGIKLGIVAFNRFAKAVDQAVIIAQDAIQNVHGFIDGFVAAFEKTDDRPPYHFLADYIGDDEMF